MLSLNSQSGMIFNARHTDDDNLLLKPALYSITKLYVSVIKEKKYPRDMFEEAVYVQEVTWWRPFTRMDAYNKYCTCYLKTDRLAAIQGTSDLFLFSLYGEFDILSLYTSMLYSMDTNKLKIFVVEEQK